MVANERRGGEGCRIKKINYLGCPWDFVSGFRKCGGPNWHVPNYRDFVP